MTTINMYFTTTSPLHGLGEHHLFIAIPFSKKCKQKFTD